MWKWLIILSLYSGVVMSDRFLNRKGELNQLHWNQMQADLHRDQDRSERSLEEKRNRVVSFMNNNPLNLRVTGERWKGKKEVLGKDIRKLLWKYPGKEKKTNRYNFERFNTPQQGIQAGLKQLTSHQFNHGKATLRDIVERHSPYGDKENEKKKKNKLGKLKVIGSYTDDYIADIADQMGVDPDSYVDLSKKENLLKMFGAMTRHEGAWKGKGNPEKYSHKNVEKVYKDLGGSNWLEKRRSQFGEKKLDILNENIGDVRQSAWNNLEKEELTQLRKEQEPEFTPDLMNEVLSQGGQSQEVMTRKPKSYDEMSFRDAFNQAWRDKGEGDVFNWKGNPILLKRK